MGNKIASPQKVNLEKAKEAFADMKNAATLNLSEDEFIKKLETDTSFAKTAYDKIFKATEHKTLDAQSADDFYKLMYEDNYPVNELEGVMQQEGNMPGMVMPEKPKKMFSSVASTIQNPLQKYQKPEDIVGPNYTFPLDVPKSEFESMEEKKAKQLPDVFVEKNPIHEIFGKDTVVGEGYYNNPVQELGQSPEKDLEIVDAALAELDKKIAQQDKKYSGMLAEMENKIKQDWTLGGGKNSVMTKKVNAENTMNDPAIQYIIQNKTALSLQKDLLETYRQYAVYDNSVQVGKQMQQMVDEGLLSQESFDYLRGVQYVDRQREAIERLAKYGKITEDTKNKLLSLGDLSNKDNIATGLLKTGKLKDFASLGLTEMTRNFDIKDIADRINEGKTVSTEERNVLAIYSKLANLTSSEHERGFWFEAGQGLQTSLQFVLSAYLTGGVSAVGKLGTTSLLKYIGKNALRQAAFVPVTPMAYRDFSAMQLNDALNGEKNTLSNLYKAYAQTFGERFSETLGVMVGNWWDGVAVFDKLLKSKPIQKAFGGAFKTMGEISNKISNNDWWKTTGKIMSEGGITSWPGEIASEGSGNVITSILTLDSEPLKEFANPRFYGQIALQSSFMSGVNLVGKTIAGGVGAGVDAYQTNKKYNQTMQMLNESAPFKDEKLENIRQRLINAINDNQYTDENGEISNSGVTNAIAELNEYVNTKTPTELTYEEIITVGLLNNAANYGIHKFGQDEAVKAYVQSQLGYEFANKDNYVYELDYEGKQYFILDTKGKAMVAVDRATGKKEVLPVEKVEAAKHSIKQTNASDWARNEFLMHVDQWRQQDKTSAVGTSAPVSNAPTDGNAQQANAQQVDNGGTPDGAVTINPEETALFDAVIIDGVQYPIANIEMNSGKCTIIDQEGNERIVDINDDEVTPIQTKFEDKEDEGKIDVPKSQQQTQPQPQQPQQPQPEQVKSENGEGELPLTKDGDIDFDALLDLSPERYAQEYVSALDGNVEEAVSDMTDELKRIDGEIKGLTTKRKSAKLANKPKISKQISDLKRKRQSIENVISLLSQKPVNEPVQPQGQQEGTKPFTAGQNIVDKWNGAKKVYGNEDTQIAPNGQVIHGRWVVTESDAATPSHDPFTYAPSEGFPKTEDGKNVNDNDYTNKVADVTTKSANFDGRAYENTPKVINGVVIDGNNRTMSRIQAAQQGTDTAYLETLRAKSASRGIPAQEYADMQNPTMYFEVTDQLPLTTETFAMFNARESKSKTPTERAIVASKRDNSRLIGNILSEISKYEKLSELYSNQNACAAIIRYMIEAGVINQNEVNELFENGSFTSNGKDFLESLLIGSVMKEDQIKELNTEGMKRFRERLIRCIIPLAENSKLKKENRILDDLNKAISYIRRAKVNNMSLRELFLQNDMFNPQTFDEGAVFVALKFMQSDAEFRDFVTMVNARLSTETPNIFTGELETKQDIYNESEQQLTDEERATLNAARETNRLNSQTETVQGDGINTEQGGPGVDADAKTEVQQVEEEVQEVEVEQEQPETIEDKEAETSQQTEEKPTQPQESQQPTAQIEEKVEEKKQEPKPIEITADLIDSLEIDDDVKGFAKDYLNGEISIITENAFKTIQDYVQNELRNGTADSTDADTAQLGSTPNDGSVSSMGDNRGENRRVDREEGEGDVSQQRPGREDSQGGLFSIPGEESNSDVESDTSNDATNSGTDRRTGSSRSGGKRSNVRKSGGSTSGSSVSTDAGRGESTSKSQIDETLESLDKELEEALSQARQLLKDSANTVGALGNAEMFKLLGVVGKIGYIYTKKGFYTFKKWYSQMYTSLSPMMQNHFTTEEIDQFIKDMWDTKVTRNGERRKISEWAAIVEQEELRKLVRMSLEEKIALQKSKENVETIVEDLDNIRESLPFLLPQQHEDVLKAETQFFSQSHKAKKYGNGKGIMFTNGTGTGKTYTGLGIVKRFIKQGKGRILIVTAQDKKIKDWIRDASNLGIEATQLKDTKDKGKGVVVTQYANMYQNRALLEDEWDLIVYDESHKIQEGKEGNETARSVMHHMLSNRDLEQAVRRQLRDHELFKREYEILPELEYFNKLLAKKLNEFDQTDKENWERFGGNSESIRTHIQSLSAELDALKPKQNELVKQTLKDESALKKAQEAVDKTKVVFLSATPFNTAMNLDYVESYIFSYNPDGQTDNGNKLPSELRAKEKEDFVLEKFPSSHAKLGNGKVIKRGEEQIANPEQSSQEEIDFSESLQEMGTLSGRVLDSEWDYSRQFPKIDFPQAQRFNQMYNALTRGKYMPLFEREKGYFRILQECNLYVPYFESIKTLLCLDRLKAHVDLGRKVVVFHRRKSNKDGGYIGAPINDAIDNASPRNETDAKLLQEFEKEFADYLAWERSANLDFAQYLISEAFATEQEKEEYKKDLEKWKEKNKTRKTPLARPVIKSKAVKIFSGTPTEKEKRENAEAFNNDSSDVKVIVVQVASGKEGVDFHDKTGNFQRAEVNLYLPESPIEFIQAEGRIYRIGQKSNAIFEYPLLGIDLELAAFAMKINGRAQTSENLALGNKSRGLRDSISRAALSSRQIDVDKSQGVGGKQLDSKATQKSANFDDAIANYNEWKDRQPGEYKDKLVPDPIGERMAAWAMPEGGDNVLVPNAGEGTVARYVDSKSRLVAYESRMDRFARLAMLCGGSGRKIENKDFELDSGFYNDNILYFIPKDAEAEAKDAIYAINRLSDSGRMVILTTSGDLIREKLATRYKYDTNIIIRAEVKLPPNIMGINRNKLEVLVIDNLNNVELQKQAKADTLQQDLSNITDEAQLWEALRSVQIPVRIIDNLAKTRKRAERALANYIETSPVVRKRASYSSTGKNKQVPDVTKFGNGCRFRLKGDLTWTINYAQITKGEAGYDIRVIENIARAWKSRYDYINEYADSTEKYQIERVESYKAVCNFIEALLGKTPPQLKNIALGINENVVTGELDVPTLRDTIKGMLGNDVALERLNDRVMKVAEGFGIGVEIVSETHSKFADKSRSVQGFYSSSDNKIWIKEEFINSARISNEQKGQVLLHEAIHGVTVYAMRKYEMLTLPESSPLYKACKDIFDVYEQIKNDATVISAIRGKNGRDAANNEYGLKDTYEMIAELSNPMFRAALKAKKLWKQLINGIKMILGMQIQGIESSETNALNVLEDALDTILDNADAEMYKKYTEGNIFGKEEYYKIRTEPAPKKTGKGYKVFVLKDGKLYPPMVANPNGEATPVGVWLDADSAPIAGQSKTGRNQVKAGGKGTQGGSGTLAYRPGWHLGEIPYAIQFNRKNAETGERELFPANFVWAEVEYADDVNYQEEAMAQGVNVNGKFQHSLAGLQRLPKDGSYRYRTNPNPETDEWIISGAMKVNRLLTPSEVDAMVREAGREPQQRQEGAITDEQIEQLNNQLGLRYNTEQSEILYRSTNETDQELTEQSKGLSEEAAETQISELSDKMKTKVHYLRNEDITGNTPTDRKKRRSKGWYQNGEVYINLSNHETVQDAVETFLHETVAHKGLRALLGDKFESVMKQVFNSLTDAQKQSLLEIFGSEVVSAEEFLASMAERDIEPSLVDKVLAIIREALREFEIISSFTNGDLQYLLWKSKNNLQEGATLAQEVRFKQKDAEVRYRTSTRPAGYSTNDIEMTWWDRLWHNIQDRMRPVKKIMEEVVRLGGVITENSDPHSQEFLSSSRAAAEIESFRNERFKPMMDKVNELVKILMEKHSVDHKEAYEMVIDYLYAKHAPERNKYICVREMKKGALSALTTDDRLKMTDNMKAQFDTMAEQIYENMFTGGKHTVNIKGNNLSDEQEKILTKLALRLQARANSISNSKEGNNRAGLTDAKAADIISRLYDSSTSTAFDQLQDLVKSCTRFTLDKWLEYGMISQADYNNYNNMFEYYIPLRSWEEKEDIPYDEINSRTFNMASELMSGNKQAKGRSSRAFDPLPYISSMASSACVSGNRNRVRQHAFNLVSNNMGKINHIGTIAKTYMVYDEDGNVMGITYKRPSQDLFDKGRVKVLKDNTYFWHKTGQQQKVHSVDVFFNGDRHTVIFKGQLGALAATAVNGTENTTRNLVVQYVAKLTRMISTNLTARNPIFLAKNLIRDLGFGNFAYFVENGWADTVKLNKYFAQAMAVAARDARGKSNNSADDLLYQEFKANGGQTGYIELESINKIDKEIQKIVAKAQGNQGVVDKLSMPVTSLFDMFEVLGKASENAMRFAIYKLSREQGLSARASAIRAKEITVNFNRKGKNTQSFSAFYAFFNPAVQGAYRFGKLAKENPRRFATAIGTLTALKFGFVMMARAFGGGGDDDELNAYDRISDYVKATNIIIPIGGEKFIAIPLPQSVRALTYIADCAADVIHGKKGFGEALGDFILFNVGEFLPLDIDSIDIDNPGKSTLKALTPTAGRPIIENIFNSDFMGNPIYKEPFILDEDGKPQYQMVFGTTSKVLVGGFELLNKLGGGDEFRSAGVKISRNGTIEPSWRTIFDWNPAKIEHVFKGYFGGMFDVFNDAVDTAFEIGDAFKGEGLDVDNIVLLKDFVRVPTSKPGYKTFYEMRDEVNDIKEQNRNYKEQYGNEYYAILKGSRFNYEITRYYDAYSRQIQSLTEMMMKVTDDKELYNEIESQRDALILEAARTYNEIKQRRDNEN